MLPAPQPTQEYLDQAAGEPTTTDTPGQMLVILDLNGTVLFRPNRNAKTMIQRPFLRPFLRYLFENFKVMVWSSARPDNVKALVNQALDNDLRSKLVAQWARDSFGLSPTNYQQNVQVYKNLNWYGAGVKSSHFILTTKLAPVNSASTTRYSSTTLHSKRALSHTTSWRYQSFQLRPSKWKAMCCVR